jgi:DNA-binding transcriptional ArsR family regulator
MGRRRPASLARQLGAPRGHNKVKVLEALKREWMTASEIAEATGIGTATVSTLMTKLSKTGEVAKPDRGYGLSRERRSGTSGLSPPTAAQARGRY